MFDLLCRAHGIEHPLTKPNHPWTNGQVERMNRTLKEATVRRYHYDSHHQLRQHIQTFLDADNLIAYAFLQYRRLKTARREKRISGPPPQPTLPAVGQAIVELIARLPPPRCPHCRKGICSEKQRE